MQIILAVTCQKYCRYLSNILSVNSTFRAILKLRKKSVSKNIKYKLEYLNYFLG